MVRKKENLAIINVNEDTIIRVLKLHAYFLNNNFNFLQKRGKIWI